jgi:AmmeMemoRadiSam system protein B
VSVRLGDVVEPAVAGRWYPSSPHALRDLVDRLIDEADDRRGDPRGGAVAAIAPHAGFAYSGAVAAAALRTVAASTRRIILLGPSHYFGFAGAAVPSRARALRTPLGDVPIDTAAVERLAEHDGVRRDDAAFVPEHALEAELPFLQRLIGTEVPVAPILLGAGTGAREAARIAEAVAPVVDAGSCIVVSSDFTHYGPRFGYVPFTEGVPERLRDLDLGAIRAIEAGDLAGFVRYADDTGATICGRRAIEVLLTLHPGAEGELLEHDTSGRMTGAWDHSVSYAALRFPAGSAPS